MMSVFFYRNPHTKDSEAVYIILHRYINRTHSPLGIFYKVEDYAYKKLSRSLFFKKVSSLRFNVKETQNKGRNMFDYV